MRHYPRQKIYQSGSWISGASLWIDVVIYKYAVSGNSMSLLLCYFIVAYSKSGLVIVKLAELLK